MPRAKARPRLSKPLSDYQLKLRKQGLTRPPLSKRLLPKYMWRGGPVMNCVSAVYKVDKHCELDDLHSCVCAIRTFRNQPRTLNQHLEWSAQKRFRQEFGQLPLHSKVKVPLHSTPKAKSSKPKAKENSDEIAGIGSVDEKGGAFDKEALGNALRLFKTANWRYGGFAFTMDAVPNGKQLGMRTAKNGAEVFGEVCVAGMSNAGKSSVVNRLMSNRLTHDGLAVVSKMPGRTRMINFYALRSALCVSDLMGYGFAKVESRVRRYWLRFLRDYFSTRHSAGHLRMVYLLMDASQCVAHLKANFYKQMTEANDTDENENETGAISDGFNEEKGCDQSEKKSGWIFLQNAWNSLTHWNPFGVKQAADGHSAEGKWAQSSGFAEKRSVEWKQLSAMRVDCVSAEDSEMMQFLDSCYVPYSIVLTKVDSLPQSQRLWHALVESVARSVRQSLTCDSHILVTSARLSFGVTELQSSMAFHCGVDADTDFRDSIDVDRIVRDVLGEIQTDAKSENPFKSRW